MLQYLGSILSMDRHDTPFNISNANVLFFSSLFCNTQSKIDYEMNTIGWMARLVNVFPIDWQNCTAVEKIRCNNFCSSLLVIQSCNVKHERVNLSQSTGFSLFIFAFAVVKLNSVPFSRCYKIQSLSLPNEMYQISICTEAHRNESYSIC